MPGATHPRSRDLLLVVVGAMLWGTGGLSGAVLAENGMRPIAVAAWRLGAGGGLLLVGLAVAGRLIGARGVHLTRPVVSRVVVTGVLAAAYQGAYFWAVVVGSVSIATLVALGAAPVMVATATAVMTRSRPAPGVVVAIALALVGLGLLLGAPASGSNPALAAVLALVPAAAFAATTVINRTAVPGLDPMLLTGLSFSFGSLLLLPAAALLGGQMYPSGGGQVALVLWLAIGPTALAYVAYFAGLRTVPGTTASVLALLEPLTASVGAAVVFGERLGLAGMIGAGLLVAGIVVLRRTPTMAPGPPLM